MEMRVIKIEGEFVVVELVDGKQKVCPIEIFPQNINMGDVVVILIKWFFVYWLRECVLYSLFLRLIEKGRKVIEGKRILF